MYIEPKLEHLSADPWTLYLYAIKSPATKEKYLMRLGKFSIQNYGSATSRPVF